MLRCFVGVIVCVVSKDRSGFTFRVMQFKKRLLGQHGLVFRQHTSGVTWCELMLWSFGMWRSVIRYIDTKVSENVLPSCRCLVGHLWMLGYHHDDSPPSPLTFLPYVGVLYGTLCWGFGEKSWKFCFGLRLLNCCLGLPRGAQPRSLFGLKKHCSACIGMVYEFLFNWLSCVLHSGGSKVRSRTEVQETYVMKQYCI